jgi:hypothetical protein
VEIDGRERSAWSDVPRFFSRIVDSLEMTGLVDDNEWAIQHAQLEATASFMRGGPFIVQARPRGHLPCD